MVYLISYNNNMQESIFTKIIKGEIPCHKIYEDEKTFAFLDIHPSNPGHILVVPKQQVEFVWDLPDQDYEARMATVKKLALHLRAKLPQEFVRSAIVGTDVPHAHVHLVPFDAGQPGEQDMDAEPDHAALAEMASKLAL